VLYVGFSFPCLCAISICWGPCGVILIFKQLKVIGMMHYFIPETIILNDPVGSTVTISEILSLFICTRKLFVGMFKELKNPNSDMKFINRTIKPDILILLETMVNYQNTNLIIK